MYIPDVKNGESLLGIHICLPAPYGEYIRNFRIASGDKSASLCPSHITLLPPTPIDNNDLDVILENLKKAVSSLKAFWIKLNGVGTFTPVSNVSYIKVVYGNDECQVLHDRILESDLINSSSQRFSFHPHVTIAHDVNEDVLKVLENEFRNFNAAFICSKIHVDLLDCEGKSETIAVLPLG